MWVSRLFLTTMLVLTGVSSASAQTWTPVQNVPNIGAGAVALLTDGRVLVHDESGNPGTWQNWWTLTPNIANGDYATGTWTQVASMPSSYGPLYFGSAVLPDGRYIVEGGEYNNGNDAWTDKGAIYDPVANTWSSVAPPSGWVSIGDSPSVILANGTFMQSSCCDSQKQAALLNAATLAWTETGAGKFDLYDEEGMTLLPGGTVLDVDAYVGINDPTGKNWETYNPNTGTWTVQGSTPVQLWDSGAACGGNGSHELGPEVLMANGTLYATGANSCAAAHTAIYTVSTSSWVAGPDFPDDLGIADGPAALEVNGNVLMMTSREIFQTGSAFFEWTGAPPLNQVPGPPNAPSDSSYYGHMLMLPTGQILFTDFSNDVELFTSAGSQYTGWTPTLLITNLTMHANTTYKFSGFKFNGVSQDNAYGDDFQDATNYPLMRFTSTSNGSVYYARTHDHSTMAVGYVGPTYTHVDIPNIPQGAYNLQVVTNGIASQNYLVGILNP
ncbi:MAG: hypothetical protein WCC87_09840 [Candidatus Korobacteraceae bacterium]